ncbi:MAG: hypothetical protein P4L53_29365 [Candidatus Obscuribacterales bacterium]|nr:hypothetical protein [Candidatus Obscuribacterales bacterium]
MSSSEKSIFGTVLGYAHRAGQVARDAANAAQAAWTNVGPGVSAALAKAKSLADPQALALAHDQFDAILARAKATGTSAMSDIQKAVTSLKEAANGMPPQVALKLATFASLQEVAASKGCLELAEVVDCSLAFNSVRESVKTDPAKSISTETYDKLDALVISAGSAVDLFSADPALVRGSLANANALLGVLRTAVAQQKGGANAENSDLGVQVGALAARLESAQRAADASSFAPAAVLVHNWSIDANKLKAITN